MPSVIPPLDGQGGWSSAPDGKGVSCVPSSLASLRDTYLERHGFFVLRFWNNQINRNMDDVMDEILPIPDRRRLEIEQENV